MRRHRAAAQRDTYKGSSSAQSAVAAAAALSKEASTPPDARFLYFNNRRTGRRGIGFGGSLKDFRLFVDASLDSGGSRGACETFTDGALAASDTFDIAALEVWGCGGKDARLAQDEWKEEQNTARRRAIRKALVDDPDDEGGAPSRAGVNAMAKEDRWMLGLLGLLGGFGGGGRDARQDAAYAAS